MYPSEAAVEVQPAVLETERLRALVVSLGLGVLVEDEARRIALVNQAFCEIFGIPLSPEELRGADCARAALQAARLVREPEAFIRRIDDLLAGGLAAAGDEISLRDGRVLECDYTPILVDAIGRGHLWLYRDVTRVRRLAALERATAVRDELRLAVDTIPGLVWIARSDGYFEFLNQRWCDFTGMQMDAACGSGWEQAIFPEDRAPLLAYWRSLITTQQSGEHEARLRRFDGAYRWFAFRAVPLRNERGELLKWYGQTTDIDDRKRADALLAGEKELLEILAQGASLPEALETLCRIIEANAPGCRCSILLVDGSGTKLELGAGPTLPRSYNVALHGRPLSLCDGPCAMAALANVPVIVTDVASDARFDVSGWRGLALDHGLGSCWSTPIRTRDARVLGTFALYRAEPGAPSASEQQLIEQLTHMASVVIERKRSEDALQRAQAELSHVTRVTTLGELAASIAHEINQPLSAMVADASACLNWLSGERPDLDKARESLQAIVKDGARAGNVLTRIRALLSRSTLAHRRCGLRAVVEAAVELVRVELVRQKIVLETSFSGNEAHVMGDAIELQQVLLNLVLNAAEAARELEPERRLVVIQTSREQREGRPWAVVSIEDRGVGIEESDLERLFTPFYTTKPGGLGMGLAIIRSIIDRHGGRVWAVSNPEFGATFRFSLPIVH